MEQLGFFFAEDNNDFNFLFYFEEASNPLCHLSIQGVFFETYFVLRLRCFASYFNFNEWKRKHFTSSQS